MEKSKMTNEKQDVSKMGQFISMRKVIQPEYAMSTYEEVLEENQRLVAKISKEAK